MKLRFKIVGFNVLLSIAYFVFLLFFLVNSKIFEQGICEFFNILSKGIILLLCYNWIHIIWTGLIIYGFIKKKKEFIWGGVFSIGLSILMFLLLILYYQI